MPFRLYRRQAAPPPTQDAQKHLERGEILTTVLTGGASWLTYPAWLLPAVAGNICGGVGMVTLLEYGQVIYGGDAKAEALPAVEKAEPKPDISTT